jgi:hypothetical protein
VIRVDTICDSWKCNREMAIDTASVYRRSYTT